MDLLELLSQFVWNIQDNSILVATTFNFFRGCDVKLLQRGLELCGSSFKIQELLCNSSFKFIGLRLVTTICESKRLRKCYYLPTYPAALSNFLGAHCDVCRYGFVRGILWWFLALSCVAWMGRSRLHSKQVSRPATYLDIVVTVPYTYHLRSIREYPYVCTLYNSYGELRINKCVAVVSLVVRRYHKYPVLPGDQNSASRSHHSCLSAIMTATWAVNVARPVLRLLERKAPPLVETRTSNISDAGEGVFSLCSVSAGQVCTVFVGCPPCFPALDASRTNQKPMTV